MMKYQILIKLFLSALFVACSTSLYLFAWLRNVEESVPVYVLTFSYVFSIIAICFVISWWLERGFFKILMEYDNSLHALTHDLRNPVFAMRGFLEYLIKEVPGPVNATQKKMLISIQRASLRLLMMINNMLDIAKIEAEEMKLELEPLSLREVGSSVLSEMEGMGENKRISFSIEGTDGNINADKVLIERTISNLISNAIKFCHDDGEIKILISEDEKNAYISVSDNGEGIPNDKQKQIFEKYLQAGKKKNGTGLGLNLCKYVAQIHKGKISVESKLGQGAKFTLSIPKNLQNKSGRIVIRK